MVLQLYYEKLTPLPPSLLGYACDHCVELTSDSPSKKAAVAFLSIAAIVFHYRVELLDFITPYVHSRFLELTLEQYVCAIGLFTVLPHFVDITYEFGYLRGLSWAIKIVTDPFTDLLDFYKYIIINPKWFLKLKDQRAVYRLDIKTKEVVKVE